VIEGREPCRVEALEAVDLGHEGGEQQGLDQPVVGPERR
jgi:hypothetical protein